jgi:hypothetical protein
MRWVEHAAHMRAMRNAYTVLVGRLKRRDLLEDVGIDGG